MIENIFPLMLALGFGVIVMAATFYCFKFMADAKTPPQRTNADINKARHRTHLIEIKAKKPKRKFWGA